jgi:hypothetical protein
MIVQPRGYGQLSLVEIVRSGTDASDACIAPSK